MLWSHWKGTIEMQINLRVQFGLFQSLIYVNNWIFNRGLKLLVKIKISENEQTPAQINFTKGKTAAVFLETFLREYVMP